MSVARSTVTTRGRDHRCRTEAPTLDAPSSRRTRSVRLSHIRVSACLHQGAAVGILGCSSSLSATNRCRDPPSTRSPKCSQYFLPVALTFVLILNVPSAGGTVPPDLLPTRLRFLSNVLPLAQGVKITRSVVYFDGAELLGPTLILVGGLSSLWPPLSSARRRTHRRRRTVRRTTLGPAVSRPQTHRGSVGSAVQRWVRSMRVVTPSLATPEDPLTGCHLHGRREEGVRRDEPH